MTQTLEGLLNTGAQLLQARRLPDALALGRDLLARFPGNAQVRLFVADVADANGDRATALSHLEAASRAEPHWAPPQLRRADLLMAMRHRREALEAMRAASGCMTDDPWQLRTLARLHSESLDPAAALPWLQRGHARFPQHPSLLFDLAVAEFQLNRVDDAERHVEALLAIEPLRPGAMHLRSMLRTQTRDRNHVADLEARLTRASHDARAVAAAGYALAKELEDLGRYDESFAALQRGARAYRSTLTYDSQAELAAHAEIRDVFTPAAVAGLGAGCSDPAPIFIVGMPRTGTTLVERILGSHSQVTSVGELTDFPELFGEAVAAYQETTRRTGTGTSLEIDFRALGERYVASARQLATNGALFIDKLPYNFLYCGYIHAALPKAKIIHLTRDPMDTCYAVYKTLFFGAYAFSYDIEELADYYLGYRKHMAHWNAVLPGRILDVSYEALVREPEAQVRRVLEWCGLPWEASVLDYHRHDRPAMTASAAQVRKPPYTESIGAWRRVESGLGRLHARLTAAGFAS